MNWPQNSLHVQHSTHVQYFIDKWFLVVAHVIIVASYTRPEAFSISYHAYSAVLSNALVPNALPQRVWHVDPATKIGRKQLPSYPFYVVYISTCTDVMKKFVNEGSRQVAQQDNNSSSSCHLSMEDPSPSEIELDIHLLAPVASTAMNSMPNIVSSHKHEDTPASKAPFSSTVEYLNTSLAPSLLLHKLSSSTQQGQREFQIIQPPNFDSKLFS